MKMASEQLSYDRESTGRGKIFIKNEYLPKNKTRKTDVLITSYRDMSTGKKLVDIKENPTIDIYILKPEYREKYDFLLKRVPISYCDKHTVKYSGRGYQSAKLVGMEKEFKKWTDDHNQYQAIKKLIVHSKRISGLDMNILDIYKMKFFNSFPENLEPHSYRKGVGDIEFFGLVYDRANAPLVNVMDSIDRPWAPINMISLHHVDANVAVHWILKHVDNKATDILMTEVKPEQWRDKILETIHREVTLDYTQEEYAIANGKKYLEYLTKTKLEVRMFDDEAEMIRDYVHHYNIEAELDFLTYWNAPFDVQYINARYDHLLGKNAHIRDLCDPVMREDLRSVYVREAGVIIDKNTREKIRIPIAAADRKSVITVTGRTNIIDSCPLYAALRATVPSKPPNYGLGTVLNHELATSKIDYASKGYNIKTIFEGDLLLASAYSVIDVIPPGYLEEVSKDIDTAAHFTVSTDINNANSVVAKTTGHFNTSLSSMGQILQTCTNHPDNKFEPLGRNGIYVPEDDQKEFYRGGIVGDISNNFLLGSDEEGADTLSNRVQDNAVDYDYKSHYPCSECANNIGEMTLVYRMRRMGDDWEERTPDERYERISNAVDAYTSGDMMTFMSDYFNFPDMSEILSEFITEVQAEDN